MTGEGLSEISAPWVYPELHFGFGNTSFEGSNDPVDLVKDVLSSLHCMAAYALPDVCPEDVPLQPPYTYNTNKLRRIENFLKEKATPPRSDTFVRKENVVDIYKAAVTVLDGLAEHNHPVAQAIAALHRDWSGRISDTTLNFVILEVLKQTHWTSLKSLLNIQVAAWRIGQVESPRL